MREKRLRKQELEEQASSSPCPSPGSTDPEPPQKPSPVPAVKKTLPIKSHDAPAATATPPSAVKSSEGLCTTQSPPVRKRIALKSKAVSPSVPSPSTAAPPPTSPPQPPLTDAAPQSPHHVSNTAATGQGLNSCSTLTHVKQTKRMASQHKTPGQSAEIKGTTVYMVTLVLPLPQDRIVLVVLHPPRHHCPSSSLSYSEAQIEREAVGNEACHSGQAGP